MNGDLFSPRQPDLFGIGPERQAEPPRKERPPIRERLKRLIAQTDDFRLLERIPLTKPGLVLPYPVFERGGPKTGGSLSEIGRGDGL